MVSLLTITDSTITDRQIGLLGGSLRAAHAAPLYAGKPGHARAESRSDTVMAGQMRFTRRKPGLPPVCRASGKAGLSKYARMGFQKFHERS
jgi:hypothetical protein